MSHRPSANFQWAINESKTRIGGQNHIYLVTVKILKFGTPQTIAIIVLKIEKFDVILH